MTDRPILFSAPMVRALLAGTKTQTRRVLDLPCDEPPAIVSGGAVTAYDENEMPYRWPRTAAVGDRLYVREAWHAARSLDSTPPRDIPRDADIEHAATARGYAEIGLKGKVRPGMHMPRWASRLTLIVTEVRVQRLQDISREDAIAEGLIQMPSATSLAVEMGCDWGFEGDSRYGSPVSAYAALWDSLNAQRGYGWSANPWIVAYSFTVQRGNIDQIGRAA